MKAQNKRILGEPLDKEEEISARGKTVVVIGGGDTGSDCIGTAIRQGAKAVHQLEIMPRAPERRGERWLAAFLLRLPPPIYIKRFSRPEFCRIDHMLIDFFPDLEYAYFSSFPQLR